MTDQPMDYRDYLIRQHQQERMAQQFDALFTKDEDHAAAATQRIEDLAYYEAQEAAAVYDVQGSKDPDVIESPFDTLEYEHEGSVALQRSPRHCDAVRRRTPQPG